MGKLSDIRDRIAQGSTAGKIYKAVAEDIVDAMEGDTKPFLIAMLGVYVEQSDMHLKDALEAIVDFKEYMKNKEWKSSAKTQ